MIRVVWIGSIILLVLLGCTSGPPRELLERNDHGGLARWYEQEAANLRGKADEMRAKRDEYADPSHVASPKESKTERMKHYEGFVAYYDNAAAEAETLAKMHRALEGSKR